MADLNKILVLCSPDQASLPGKGIVTAINAAKTDLTPEQKKRLSRILSYNLISNGSDGAYSALNNRTVLDIFSEYPQDPLATQKALASGEVDGLRYQLFEGSDGSQNSGDAHGDSDSGRTTEQGPSETSLE